MARYDISPFTREMERVDAIVPVGTVVTSTGTVQLQDEYIPVDATSGAVVLTLPPSIPINRGKQYAISKRDVSNNTVTVDGYTTDTINGATTQVISFQYNTMQIVCNGDGTWSIK